METWECKTYKFNTGCGSMYVTIDGYKNKPIHCFIQNTEGCSTIVKITGIAISKRLKRGDPLDEILEPYETSVCPQCISSQSDGKSCCAIVAKCLKEFGKVKHEVLKSPF